VRTSIDDIHRLHKELSPHSSVNGRPLRGGVEFRDLLSALPAAIYVTDADGRITYYNAAAAQLWGCEPELGTSMFCGSWKLYWPDGRPMRHDQCPMAETLRTGTPVRGAEAVAERPDGTRVPFIPFPTPLFDAAGQLSGAINMLVDITERKAMEHRLYESDRRLAAIVEASTDAIASKDLNGIVRSWNHGAERLFGYAAEEMIGKPVTRLIPADRQREEDAILERIRRGERVEPYETLRARKDGTLVDVELSVSPIRDIEGRIVGASKIARDISERKQAQTRQELLSRELHHRTKNLFAVVDAVVARSFAGKSTIGDAEAAVRHRLYSLAQTHVMLLDKQWQGADLCEIVRTEMTPYAGRVMIDGPSITLDSQATQNFALALHELATNAAKYGALSNQAGQVRVAWSVVPSMNGPSRFQFRWEEQGGPPVSVPEGRGFGSTVLEQVMAEYFDNPPRIEFAPSGVRYELSGTLQALTGKDQCTS
jgi:PAS domain S-box-containing protein